MKRFVFRLASFALIVIVTVGGFCVAEVAAEIRAYHRELIAQPGATIFVCGDSRTEWELNPEFWPELFNFSVSGRPMDQVYLTALDVLRANPGKFRTMLVDVSVETAKLDYDLPVERMPGGTKYLLLYLLHRDEPIRSLTGWLGLFRDVMTERRLRHVWQVVRGKKRFQSSLASGYNCMTHCLKSSDPEKFRARNRRWCEQTRALLDSPSSRSRYFELLDRIVRLARNHAIECVFITPPWHPDLLEMAGAGRIRGFVDVVARYAEQKGCRYVDMTDMRLPEDCWADGTHLNHKGAKRMTIALRDLVMSGK